MGNNRYIVMKINRILLFLKEQMSNNNFVLYFNGYKMTGFIRDCDINIKFNNQKLIDCDFISNMERSDFLPICNDEREELYFIFENEKIYCQRDETHSGVYTQIFFYILERDLITKYTRWEIIDI